MSSKFKSVFPFRGDPGKTAQAPQANAAPSPEVMAQIRAEADEQVEAARIQSDISDAEARAAAGRAQLSQMMLRRAERMRDNIIPAAPEGGVAP